MEWIPYMIAALAEAITSKLKADGLDIREIGYRDLVDGTTINLTKPAVNVVVQSATYQQVTMTTYKARCDVSVYVVIQNMKPGIPGDAQRREAVYAILEGVTQSLMIQKFVDEVEDMEGPLFPESFRAVTSPEYARAGFQMYELRFWCTMAFTQADPAGDLGPFLSILANYYLPTGNYFPTGGHTPTGPDAQDVILIPTGAA